MLETDRRRLFLDALHPPPGMRLDRAIGTTYSLDLLSLLIAPLAFSLFDQENEEGELDADPLALLESLRRHAGRLRLFCQAGRIRVPKPDQRLLAFLEEMVIEAKAPREGGVFHPKTWLLRYESEDGERHHRFLCASRNLTFDHCWDTALVLEGTPQREPQPASRPIADFVRSLGRCAVRGLGSEDAEALEDLAAGVERVRFEPPEGFDELVCWPLGLTPGSDWPFVTERPNRPALVISPFLSPGIIQRFAKEQRLETLLSTPEELDQLEGSAKQPGRCFVLAPEAELSGREASEEVEETPEVLSGLHAKLYVIDDGYTARVWTGSANATNAAFHRNVEFLVELRGPKSKCGIAALLGSDEPGAAGLQGLLAEYEPKARTAEEQLAAQLSRELERAAQSLAEAKLTITVAPAADQKDEDDWYDWSIDTTPLEGLELPEGMKLLAWPASLHRNAAVPVTPPAEIHHSLSFKGLTAFVAFEARLEREGTSVESSFVLRLPLLGAPADRGSRLLRSLLDDEEQVLRLLLLLLAEDGFEVAKLITTGAGTWNAAATMGFTEATLLEALLRTLAQSPRRLDDIARLLQDLSATPEGAALLPKDLDAIWQPIWQVRQELEP